MSLYRFGHPRSPPAVSPARCSAATTGDINSYDWRLPRNHGIPSIWRRPRPTAGDQRESGKLL